MYSLILLVRFVFHTNRVILQDVVSTERITEMPSIIKMSSADISSIIKMSSTEMSSISTEMSPIIISTLHKDVTPACIH